MGFAAEKRQSAIFRRKDALQEVKENLGWPGLSYSEGLVTKTDPSDQTL
jgi:hypothetical protein